MWGKIAKAGSWLGVALLTCLLGLLCLGTTAQAKQIQQYFYSGELFDAGGSNPAAIATDSANQKLLVVGNDDQEKELKVSKFNLNGDPAGFSGRGEATSFHTGVKLASVPAVAIVVDESGTASDGNFYIASTEPASGGTDRVYGYAPDGNALPGFPFSLPGVCGIADAPDGNFWVASDKLGAYAEISASGAPTGRVLFPEQGRGNCRIEIDSAGNLYVGRGERMAKYDSSLHFLSDLGPGSPQLAFDRADDTLFELFAAGTNPISQVDSLGGAITTFGGPDPAHFSYGGLDSTARDLAVDSQTHKVYVLKGGEVNVFSRDPTVLTVPTVSTDGVKDLTGSSATLTGTLDPDGIDTTDCRFEWGTHQEGSAVVYDKTAPCAEGNVFPAGSGGNVVTASIAGLKKGSTYHFRLSSQNPNGVAGVSRDADFSAADPPALGAASANHITTDSARISLELNTSGADTDYHVEIGTDTNYGASFPVPDATASSTKPADGFEGTEAILTPQAKTQEISGLSPETLYHYRVVAENPAGTVAGADHTFRTFALPTDGADPCSNAQARQQTSAAGLLDCRAYELVSAPNTGGYDVRSDLTPGVSALATSPQASDATLYSMRSGTIPGIAGHPTNRGADPYVATRDSSGWSTRYVGLASNNPFAVEPFASPASGFDAALETFSFGGEEICNPCFADGSTDVPLRLPDASLVKGMAGSLDPGPAEPAGTVVRPLSADGSHLVFATNAQFEPAGNSNGTDATIYSRDLKAGTTEVISTDETGATIQAGEELAELGLSSGGSRVLFGEELAADSAGNRYFHLYLHIAGTEESVDLMPGATEGALFGGISADASKVFFSTKEPLAAGETDTSVDIYEAEVSGPGPITPKLISKGLGGSGDTDLCSPPGIPNSWNAVSGAGKCNAVAFAGGAGLAANAGSFYFLSPEQLDGPSNGTQGQPNLFVAEPGASTPSFVATIDSSLGKPPPSPPSRPVVTKSFGGSHAGPEALAVDQSNGDVYVAEAFASRVSRYTAAGAPKPFTEGPGASTNRIPGLTFVELVPEVAIDNSGGPFDGAIYVTNYPGISVYSQTGELLGQLTGAGKFSEACGVAVDQSNGDVYVGSGSNIWRYSPTGSAPIDDSDYAVTGIDPGIFPCTVAADNGNVYGSTWPSGPVSQFSAASFESSPPSVSGTQVNSQANALSIDPVTHELYVDEGNKIVTFDSAGVKQLTIGASEISSSRGVAVNAFNHHVYASSGSGVTEFGYDVEPYEPIDNPAVVHAIKQADTYDSADFEVTSNGRYAAFASLMPLNGYESGGRYEVFRHEPDADATLCVSCSPTLSRPASDATLTPYGSSLTEDGRVFFTTGEQLTLRDTNEKLDAYEWKDGKQELISTGTSPTDSKLLSVSADGTDAFFFTRQKLVPEDQNGSNIRLYTAREEGGFAFGPPRFQCAASDECHGASSVPTPPLSASTKAGTPGQFNEKSQSKCRKGTVKRRGRCVKRHPHKRRPQDKRAAKAKQGGGK